MGRFVVFGTKHTPIKCFINADTKAKAIEIANAQEAGQGEGIEDGYDSEWVWEEAWER